MAKNKDDRLEDLKTSFEKVWLAGLGALAQAEKQGGKLFKTLVKKGKKYEVLIPIAGDAVKDSVKAARKQANETFQGMEAAFDRQVKAAMKRAGDLAHGATVPEPHLEKNPLLRAQFG